MQNKGKERSFDIVFCVDGGGSMNNFITNSLKDTCRRFIAKLCERSIGAMDTIKQVRAKIIVFRDYEYDEDAMFISPFYEIPVDYDAFDKLIDSLDGHGGGDFPNNGFEALYYALKSEWVTGNFDRQIVVLFSNNDALELGARKDSPSYPEDMVDMKGLEDLWSCHEPSYLRDRLKRLVVVSPRGSRYQNQLKWNRTIFIDIDYGSDISDLDFEDIFR